MGWVVNAMPRPSYPPERDPIPIVDWVGPGVGLDGCEKSRPIRIQTPDRPTHKIKIPLVLIHVPRDNHAIVPLCCPVSWLHYSPQHNIHASHLLHNACNSLFVHSSNKRDVTRIARFNSSLAVRLIASNAVAMLCKGFWVFAWRHFFGKKPTFRNYSSIPTETLVSYQKMTPCRNPYAFIHQPLLPPMNTHWN
jgi:hypothetical protein